MKQFATFILAAMLMLSMTACSEEEGSTAEQNTTQNTETTVTLDTEDEKPEAEPSSDEEEEIEPEEIEPAEGVDYSGEFGDWLYLPESEDETTVALMEIDACEYGTAGASLKQTSAAVQILQLSQKETITEDLTAYLDGMSETQKDFFSFQWQMAVDGAKELLDADDAAALLEEAGHGDIDLSQFSEDSVDLLDENVRDILTEQSVEDAWKEHSDIEPFIHWAQKQLANEATNTL